jgi:predicted peptidase
MHTSKNFTIYQTCTPGAPTWREVSETAYFAAQAAQTPCRKLVIVPAHEIQVRRWQDRNGSTYHSVRIYELVANQYNLILSKLYAYGYGDGWTTTACDLMATRPDLFPTSSRACGNGTRYLRDVCNIDYIVIDVSRKSDM